MTAQANRNRRPADNGAAANKAGDLGGSEGIYSSTPEDASIIAAAKWYAANGRTAQRPLPPNICERFGLKHPEAIRAIRLAHEYRSDR